MNAHLHATQTESSIQTLFYDVLCAKTGTVLLHTPVLQRSSMYFLHHQNTILVHYEYKNLDAAMM